MRGAAQAICTLTTALLCLAAAPVLACQDGPLNDMMEAPLPAKPDKSFDIEESIGEGGTWVVYFKPDGKTLAWLVRNDFLEMSREQRRLIVYSPDAYAVTNTKYWYSAPLSEIVTHEDKETYIYCDGKLRMPIEGGGDDYAARAKEAMNAFDAPEVAAYLKGLPKN
jgi:hypothetical protein